MQHLAIVILSEAASITTVRSLIKTHYANDDIACLAQNQHFCSAYTTAKSKWTMTLKEMNIFLLGIQFTFRIVVFIYIPIDRKPMCKPVIWIFPFLLLKLIKLIKHEKWLTEARFVVPYSQKEIFSGHRSPSHWIWRIAYFRQQ